MRILHALVLTVLVVPSALAQTPDCVDYAGVPSHLSSISNVSDCWSLVVAGDDLCAIGNYHFELRGWHLGPDGVPQPGGTFEPLDGSSFGQIAAHGNRIYAACHDFGVIIFEMSGGAPAPVDSILVTRSARMAAVVDDLLITNRGDHRLLFFDLAGPTPVLTDSLDLAGFLYGGARGGSGLALVQTSSPPRAHLIDPAAAVIVGSVDIPITCRDVSWDGRLALLHEADIGATHLLDASNPTSPVLRPLPTFADLWLVGGALVDGDLWLSGCDFDHGGVIARFDVADPANPVYLGHQPGNGAIAEAVTVGDVVHALTVSIIMCTNGESLESTTIGTSDPTPEPIGVLVDNDLNSLAHAVASGDVLCSTDGRDLQIVDFADPTAPVLRGDVALPEDLTSPDIHLAGSSLVVTGSGSGVGSVGGRIYVYDIADPDLPALRSTEVCIRFWRATADGDRVYTADIYDDLHVWQLETDGSLRHLAVHANLTYDDFTLLLASGDLLFAGNHNHYLEAWDLSDPNAPVALSNLPAGEVGRLFGLERWAGGIYWSGLIGTDQTAVETMTIEDGVPTSVRTVWRETEPSAYWTAGTSLIAAGDRLYIGGMGVLAVGLDSEPPATVGTIPAFVGSLNLVNGYLVNDDYWDLEVWAPACGLVTAVPESSPPVVASLEAWPNPFNPRLTVAFALPEAGTVDVGVFDLRGRRVRSLLGGFREAGRHLVQWDGRDDGGRAAAAGVYVVRLDAGERSVVRRVTLVK